jgi:hypothetical protein
MPKNVQVCWIERAETRSVTEHAMLQRAASEPHVSIVYAEIGAAWFGWLRELRRPLGHASTPARSPPAEMRLAEISVATRQKTR